MAFDNKLAEDVLKHADIVKVVSSYLTLVRQGKNYKAVCPFHDDTNPSLTVSPEKQMFKCFVCGVGGSAFTFVQRYEHVSFGEAVKKVADICDYHPQGLESYAKPKKVDQKREDMLKCLHDLSLYYQFALNTPEGKAGLDYFESRKLDASIRNKYKLGYSPKDGRATIEFLQKKGHSIKTIEDTGVASIISSNSYKDMNEGRVTFSICDIDGNVIGFSARRLTSDGKSPKYMNTPETYVFHKTNNLYNINIAKDACKLKRYIYVCEGFMDVYALSKIGIDAAVATMGTALTSEHIQLLKSLNVEVRLCLDGDLPGQTAMMKISKDLAKAGVNFRVVDNQGSDKDPDEILNEDGKVALEEYLNKLVGHNDFALNYYLRSNPLKTMDEKKTLIKEYLPILLRINSQLELDNYLRKLSKITGFESDSIRKVLVNARKEQVSGNQTQTKKLFQDFHPEREALKKLATAERELLYQMSQNKAAVSFYEQNINGFYDDIYRQIANYMIEYSSDHEKMDPNGIITLIESDETGDKDEILKDLTTLLEETHPLECSDSLLTNLLDTINSEKQRISEEDILQDSLKGKSELEQARIIAEFRRRKANKN